MASYAVRSRTAIIEMAEPSGLSRLPGGTRRPFAASSRGTGELIDTAIKGGAEHVVLGLGGSACTDGGTGMATALGMRFLDQKGRELPPGGGALRDLHAIVPATSLAGSPGSPWSSQATWTTPFSDPTAPPRPSGRKKAQTGTR